MKPLSSEMKAALKTLLHYPLIYHTGGFWAPPGTPMKKVINENVPMERFATTTLHALWRRGWIRDNQVVKNESGKYWVRIEKTGHMTEQDIADMKALGDFLGAKRRYYIEEPDGLDLIDLNLASKNP